MKRLKKKLQKSKLPEQLPTLSRAAKRSLKRTQSAEEKFTEALSNVPQITNETVSEHREQVLAGARKYIYPLQHSKHRVVRISLGLFALVVVGFFALCLLSLYRFQTTSAFMHDVTRIIPFPVGKAGNDWVSYESYLFELRRNMHYYKTQQQADFSTRDGEEQLKRLKEQALDQVVLDAYVKQLAEQNGVSVSSRAVDNQVELVRSQNRLGNNDRVFKDVLNEFWGWSESDFKRELKQQLLQQAVVSKLDTKTKTRADAALVQLKGGADFAKVAAEQSDDPATKGNGGAYGRPVTPGDRELSPLITAEIFKLKPGQTSGIINAGYTLEILKVTEINAGSAQVAHIQFNLADINTYVKPYQAKHPGRQYIRF